MAWKSMQKNNMKLGMQPMQINYMMLGMQINAKSFLNEIVIKAKANLAVIYLKQNKNDLNAYLNMPKMHVFNF
jgi:hypothetical protein